MYGKQEVYRYLNEYGIEYEVAEHVPVFTVDEMFEADIPHPELIAKNLFVRDDKKKNFYLITCRENRVINLKEFRKLYGTRPLSFASEEALMEMMGLTKGSVTPFGLLNDIECRVTFFLDKEYVGMRIGIHPNENTSTVFLETVDLIRLMEISGHSVTLF